MLYFAISPQVNYLLAYQILSWKVGKAQEVWVSSDQTLDHFSMFGFNFKELGFHGMVFARVLHAMIHTENYDIFYEYSGDLKSKLVRYSMVKICLIIELSII